MISRERSQKLYSQIYDILEKEIEDGKWPVDSQIPTEDNLCSLYGVSKATIRLALSELARQGYLRRIQGKGTFVCKKTSSDGLWLSSRLEEFMMEPGMELTTKMLAQTVMMPTDDLDTKMNISMEQHLIYIKRLRNMGNETIMIQETYVPYHLCPSILKSNVEHESIIDLLEKNHGIIITRVTEHLDITYMTAEESRIFGLQEGTAALYSARMFFSGDSRIMYIRSVKRPDKLRMYIQFARENA
jgi:DNA-binding GntR family transcriptional regulator